ncbi:hypothetical protein WDU94_002733 [Cyamophila willieti]
MGTNKDCSVPLSALLRYISLICCYETQQSQNGTLCSDYQPDTTIPSCSNNLDAIITRLENQTTPIGGESNVLFKRSELRAHVLCKDTDIVMLQWSTGEADTVQDENPSGPDFTKPSGGRNRASEMNSSLQNDSNTNPRKDAEDSEGRGLFDLEEFDSYLKDVYSFYHNDTGDLDTDLGVILFFVEIKNRDSWTIENVTNENFMTVKHLSPNTEYKFRIVRIERRGRGGGEGDWDKGGDIWIGLDYISTNTFPESYNITTVPVLYTNQTVLKPYPNRTVGMKIFWGPPTGPSLDFMFYNIGILVYTAGQN